MIITYDGCGVFDLWHALTPVKVRERLPRNERTFSLISKRWNNETEKVNHSHNAEYWLKRAEQTNCHVAEFVGCLTESDLERAKARFERKQQTN